MKEETEQSLCKTCKYLMFFWSQKSNCIECVCAKNAKEIITRKEQCQDYFEENKK